MIPKIHSCLKPSWNGNRASKSSQGTGPKLMANSLLCCKHSWHCYRAPRHLSQRCRDASGEAMRNLTFSGKEKLEKKAQTYVVFGRTPSNDWWSNRIVTAGWLQGLATKGFFDYPNHRREFYPTHFSGCTETRSQKNKTMKFKNILVRTTTHPPSRHS